MTEEKLVRRSFAKKKTYQEKFVRSGWGRFTTYLKHEQVGWLKKLAVKRKVYLTDLMSEIVDEYRTKTGNNE
jgi:hypothetical protein